MSMRPFRIALAAYAVVWLLVVGSFWFVMEVHGRFSGAGSMLYAIVSYFIALPLATLLSSAIIGRSSKLGIKRLLAPVAALILYELAQVSTVGIMRGLDGVASLHVVDPASAIVAGFIPSTIGLAVGAASVAKRRSL